MPLRILVVEDHAPFRRLTCAALRRQAEFEIVEAVDGLEAIRKAEDLQPDLILLDINLPGMHGFEVAKRILALVPQARVLFLSQEGSPDIVQEALSLGARGYVQKLSAATDLLPAVEAVLAGRRFVSRNLAFADPIDLPVARRHEILFCSDDAAIVGVFARYVSAALSAGDAAIVLATPSHRSQLLRELRARGVDVDGAVGRGTCLSFDAGVAPDPIRFVEAIDSARAAAGARKAHPRVAFCGERAGRLWAAGRTSEAVQLERRCGELAPDVDILCVYPVPYPTDDETLRSVCAEHTTVSTC